jgi:Asp-tRNA(Asn)/Glu-tRNA(Gln) amidotransferase A subunit family amidase
VARGELLRTLQWHRVRELLAERDVWITPTMAVPAFPVEHPHVMEIDGQPVGKAMQRSYLTCAWSVLGLPVGLQLVGKRRGEAAVLQAAAAFEAAEPWADHLPPVVRAPEPGSASCRHRARWTTTSHATTCRAIWRRPS